MVTAKVIAGGVSLVLSWVLLICGLASWHWIWDVPLIWVGLEAGEFRGFESGSFHGGLVLLGFAIVLSWRAILAFFPFGVSGRKGLVELGLVSVLAQLVVLVSVVWSSQPSSESNAQFLSGLLWLWVVAKVLIVGREVAGGWRQKRRFDGWVWGNVAGWLIGLFFCVTFQEWLTEFLGCPDSVSLPFCLVLMPVGSPLVAARLLSDNRHKP